jgi:hypothetical protein
VKKLVLLFCTTFFFFCENPDPDLAARVFGKYDLTEVTKDSVVKTVWSITGIDHTHINLTIDTETVLSLDTTQVKKKSIFIGNILVKKRDTTLEFANSFTDQGVRYDIVGTAHKRGSNMICDLIVTDPSGKSAHWNQTLSKMT